MNQNPRSKHDDAAILAALDHCESMDDLIAMLKVSRGTAWSYIWRLKYRGKLAQDFRFKYRPSKQKVLKGDAADAVYRPAWDSAKCAGLTELPEIWRHMSQQTGMHVDYCRAWAKRRGLVEVKP